MKKAKVGAVLCAALGNIIWGFSFLFTKVGLQVAPSPNVMLGHRFLISTLFMSIPLLLGREKISFKGKDWRPIAILLLMQTAYYFCETYGLMLTNSIVAGMVLAAVPVVAIGTGALFLREYPSRRQALFCLLPVAGVIIMTVAGQELGVVTPLGIFLLIMTMVASAIYKTANRSAATQFSTYERTFLIMANSALVFCIVGMANVNWSIGEFTAPLLDGKYLLSVCSLSLLCSIAANLLVNYAAGQMSVFKVSAFGALSTLCSTLAGVVFLHEPMNWSLLLGGVLILVGIRQVTKQEGEK